MIGQDSLKTRRTLNVDDREYDYFSLEASSEVIGDISSLPYTLKVLLENLLRHEDGRSVTVEDIQALSCWLKTGGSDREISFRPGRVLMQDFTGVPAVVDLAAMRDAMVAMGGNPEKINPVSPVDLVIDHSVMVDSFGNSDAFQINVEMEFSRNRERYEFLRWGQGAFDNFRVVPPGTGICHQINLEYLAQTVWSSEEDGRTVAYPDTLVGTDSHTTMVNGLAVLGWGVGGIEAEAAMLGQPISMLIPEVVGFELVGTLPEGATATDAVLTVTQMLRTKGVVGKFVEFFGDGLDNLSLADQATIANMAPEYGATCGFFPVGQATLDYLKLTNRDVARVALVEAYAKTQGMWRDATTPIPQFSDTLRLDLSLVESSLAGPKRPQDRIGLRDVAISFNREFEALSGHVEQREVTVTGTDFNLADGAIVIASVTSCTNTSNPGVLVAAGLLAKNARERGLTVKPWVKTSFAPGSKVVTDYLVASGLQTYLDELGYNLVGYGCTTCIGNSGPLSDPITAAIEDGNLTVAAVLSGNRNFEGRIHPLTSANYLASPPLVLAYALVGSINADLYTDPLGTDENENLVYLRDIWPSNTDVQAIINQTITPAMYKRRYSDVFQGDKEWQSISTYEGRTYSWKLGSTYVQNPPYFEDMSREIQAVENIMGARVLALLADSVTTDHISPAGTINSDTPAGEYLVSHQVPPRDYNSYGSRRGNHQVMMRGTFANIRIRNEMVQGKEGGVTKHYPSGEILPIYDAAMRYKSEGIPLVVVAGKEYGTGSSRDWAAKGTRLLGIKAVIVESFERIHRSNLVGMGILPLQFKEGVNRESLKLDGSEIININNLDNGITPRMEVEATVLRSDGSTENFITTCRIDTLDEVEYYRHGGILHYVLRSKLKDA